MEKLYTVAHTALITSTCSTFTHGRKEYCSRANQRRYWPSIHTRAYIYREREFAQPRPSVIFIALIRVFVPTTAARRRPLREMTLKSQSAQLQVRAIRAQALYIWGHEIKWRVKKRGEKMKSRGQEACVRTYALLCGREVRAFTFVNSKRNLHEKEASLASE